MPPDPTSPLFPYTTLFRSVHPPICIDMTKTMTKMASMMLKKDQKIFVDFSGVIFFKMTLRTIRKQAVTILIIRKYTISNFKLPFRKIFNDILTGFLQCFSHPYPFYINNNQGVFSQKLYQR